MSVKSHGVFTAGFTKQPLVPLLIKCSCFHLLTARNFPEQPAWGVELLINELFCAGCVRPDWRLWKPRPLRVSSLREDSFGQFWPSLFHREGGSLRGMVVGVRKMTSRSWQTALRVLDQSCFH